MIGRNERPDGKAPPLSGGQVCRSTPRPSEMISLPKCSTHPEQEFRKRVEECHRLAAAISDPRAKCPIPRGAAQKKSLIARAIRRARAPYGRHFFVRLVGTSPMSASS
jgi:hypothetical protein